MKEDRPQTINIHGREYMPVSERVKMAHTELKDNFSILTELISIEPVVFRATVTTPKGSFTGWSSANPSKQIERANPYEVAETSAVGRALGFASFGIIDSIATSDEVINAIANEEHTVKSSAGYVVTVKQRAYIKRLLGQKGHSEKELLVKYDVSAIDQLTGDQASTIIENLMKLPDKNKQETLEKS